MIHTWLGSKKIAVVPTFKRGYDTNPTDDWQYNVMSRLFYDPDLNTGIDGSLQNYIQSTSGGRASLDATIFPNVWSDGDDTPTAALQSLPANHGFTHLITVLPHSVGQHRGGYAWWDMSPQNGITAIARVAMFDNVGLSKKQPIGVWAMETLHMVTGMGDLYNTLPNLGAYDVMAGASSSSHPSVHTKSVFGWINPATIRLHNAGSLIYRLHAVSLPHPPPPDRAAAVKINSRHTNHHFIIEARKMTDRMKKLMFKAMASVKRV